MPEWPSDLQRRTDAFCVEHRLQPAVAQRWRALDRADAAAVLDLAEALRLGENHLRDFLEWADEIAVRDATSIAAVLGGEAVRAARERDLGRNEAIKAVREALRRVRFPRLSALEDDLARRVRALALPPGVRVLLPPNLLDTEVRVELRGADLASFRAAVERLHAAVQRTEFAEIFALLAEAP